MLPVLKRCIESTVPAEIIYLASNGQITQRTIIIQEIKDDTIKALCLLRNQQRVFRIENILAAKMTRKKQKKPA
ncbi:hypothetical protein ACFOU2_11380 [Bacillus songklensis]|uniref:WYL domain-containing protein n=1 Tax=Bacillus songklensis TaxID=1069116 RepID=A0ABV8B1B6_9BACI